MSGYGFTPGELLTEDVARGLGLGDLVTAIAGGVLVVAELGFMGYPIVDGKIDTSGASEGARNMAESGEVAVRELNRRSPAP